jgi:predicted alpha/beta-hydrolase family hydrolase
MNILFDGPENGPLCVFAHGAGAPMDSNFMNEFALGLAKQGIRVARFEFPYMQERRLSGKKRPPNRQPELIKSFEAVIDELSQPCVIIGKSMGGRMASVLASSDNQVECDKSVASRSNVLDQFVKGVCAVGYPFHPQGKPEKLRIDHLPSVRVPMSIIQGTRDALGNKEEVVSFFTEKRIPSTISMLWLEDGDHDLKPRKKSGHTHEKHKQEAIEYCASFIKFCFSDRKIKTERI